MKLIFILLSFATTNALANQVIPKSFGVQYLSKSITGEPFVNYTLTISANDFPSTKFNSLGVSLVDNTTNSLIVKPRIVYMKSPGTTIIGSDVITFSFEGLDALYNLKNIKNSSLVFEGDDHSTFSINLQILCASKSANFLNLNGGSGCNLDPKSVDNEIKAMELEASGNTKSCNTIEDLKPLIELMCTTNMQNTKKKTENQFHCIFDCK